MRNGTMIKVIASDMDGTLLGDSHRLDEETFEVIEQAQKRGIRFMLATGRNYEGAMHAMGELGQRLTCDYLVGSGAEVRNPKREVVSRKEMDKTLCKDVYEILQRYPVSVIFCTDSKDYQVGTPEEVEEGMLVHLELFYENMTREEILKSDSYRTLKEKTCVLRTFDELQRLDVPIFKLFIFSKDVEMLGELQKELETDDRIAVASSFSTNLEITDVRAQKGPVLKEYIESLGYTMEEGTPEDVEMLGELQEVMVFGDSLNDFSMLEMDFGATVAMENADPEVKAVAKYVTKSNTEHGVAYVIEKLLESLAE